MMLIADARSPAGAARWEAGHLAVVATLFEHFVTHADSPERTREAHARNDALLRAVACIDERFRERITLEQLGRAARYHPGYLSGLFSAQLGMTSTEYITRVRLRAELTRLSATARELAGALASLGQDQRDTT